MTTTRKPRQQAPRTLTGKPKCSYARLGKRLDCNCEECMEGNRAWEELVFAETEFALAHADSAKALERYSAAQKRFAKAKKAYRRWLP